MGKVLLMGSDDGDDETQEEEMEDEGQEELGKTGAAKGKGGKSEKVDGGAKNTEKAGKKGDEEKETGEEDADEEETTERKDNHKADGKAKEDAEGEGEKSGAHPRFAASADKRIMVLVYIMWTLFVLQIVMGFWNFGRHLREDWVVRGYRL